VACGNLAFEQRQNLLPVFQNFTNGDLQILDLRQQASNGGVREKMILESFNHINYGEAFMVLSNRELACQHHTLHKIPGYSFAWEVVETGPEEWRVKVGKLN
jgi:uncharacterized protein (DUF2249 family)